MANDKDALLGMGFEPARVEWALKATGNRGLQPAMDHIFENDGKPIPDLGGISESKTPQRDAMDVDDDEDTQATQALGETFAEAKSIKCSQCGKIFKNTALANFHAEKSGHDQFEESTEEIKPLTEEEKKQKLAELREKMAAKRAMKSVEEAKETKTNEAIRRKQGKDLNKIKEDMKMKEVLKEQEQRKRDKIADAKAKAAIKAQIEADKKARAEKAAREKALRDGLPLPGYEEAAAPFSVLPTPAASGSGAGSATSETRLQIRMSTGGKPYTTTLNSDAPLREVAEYLAGQTMAVNVESVTFSSQFPRKTYTSADFSRTLQELGLAPSAVLTATPGA